MWSPPTRQRCPLRLSDRVRGHGAEHGGNDSLYNVEFGIDRHSRSGFGTRRWILIER
jgi:hypothetical protein